MDVVLPIDFASLLFSSLQENNIAVYKLCIHTK